MPDVEAMRDQLKIAQFDLESGGDVVFRPRDGSQEMPDFPPERRSGDPLDSELWPLIA